MLEVNLFGTKILLPKDAGAATAAGAGAQTGRTANGAGAGKVPADLNEPTIKGAAGKLETGSPVSSGSGVRGEGGVGGRSDTVSATSGQQPRRPADTVSDDTEIDDGDL